MKPVVSAPRGGERARGLDPLGGGLRNALAELVREAVTEALAELRQDTPAAVLTVDALCAALSCSRSTVNKLRAEGMPTLMLGDSPRFRLTAVLEWLQEREGRGLTEPRPPHNLSVVDSESRHPR